VNGTALFAERECAGGNCSVCPLSRPLGRCGLLWIGEQFYPTPGHWLREANGQGISRRIPAVPKDFVLGQTWVLCAHRKAIEEECPVCSEVMRACDADRVSLSDCPRCKGTGIVYTAGIFHVWRPSAIEYVVKGDETDEQLAALEKRGITPVKVEVQGGPVLNGMEA
jgi:hypothetical protein